MLNWGQAPYFNTCHNFGNRPNMKMLKSGACPQFNKSFFLARARKCLTRPYHGTTVTNAARAERHEPASLVREYRQLLQRDVSSFARSGTPNADPVARIRGKEVATMLESRHRFKKWKRANVPASKAGKWFSVRVAFCTVFSRTLVAGLRDTTRDGPRSRKPAPLAPVGASPISWPED